MRSGIARRGTVCERAKKISMRGALRGASGAPAAPSMPAPASSSLLLALGRRRRRANRRRQRRRGGVRRGPGVRTRQADNPPARPGGAHLLRCRCWARRRDFKLCACAGGWTVAGLLHAVQSPFLQHQNPTPGCAWRGCAASEPSTAAAPDVRMASFFAARVTPRALTRSPIPTDFFFSARLHGRGARGAHVFVTNRRRGHAA